MTRRTPPDQGSAATRTSSTWNGGTESEHRLQMAGWLAGFMAHEINNHLAAALIELELALGRSHAPETDELLARLHVAVESAGEVCRSTLGLLRPALDNGMPGPVGEAIDRTLACLGRLRERVVVEVSEETRLVATPLSLPRMQQVLLNTILNALQAGGGKVFVAARSTGRSVVACSTWNTPGSPVPPHAFRLPAPSAIELTIEDDGPGMPAEVRARLASSSIRRPSSDQGGGFGLSILHRLVVDAGGTIRVESAAPRGTRLIVTLPAITLSKSNAA